MKLSVIFGVFHMSLGIVLKGFNLVAKKMWLELVTEVVGGFFILFFLFGWMDVLIMVKWFKTPNIENFEPCTVSYDGLQGCNNPMPSSNVIPTVGMYENA
jgi:vacuolar-type H+-ATPase subunit I/STV1